VQCDVGRLRDRWDSIVRDRTARSRRSHPEAFRQSRVRDIRKRIRRCYQMGREGRAWPISREFLGYFKHAIPLSYQGNPPASNTGPCPRRGTSLQLDICQVCTWSSRIGGCASSGGSTSSFIASTVNGISSLFSRVPVHVHLHTIICAGKARELGVTVWIDDSNVILLVLCIHQNIIGVDEHIG